MSPPPRRRRRRLPAPRATTESPSVHGHVRRAALLEALGACHERTAITWVVGLPASGKTSAVARWIDESKTRAVWYRVRHDDADGAGFFDAMRRALARTDPTLPVWSPENQVELSDFSQHFFSELGDGALTLVLDDCHRIGDDAALFTAFVAFHELAGTD